MSKRKLLKCQVLNFIMFGTVAILLIISGYVLKETSTMEDTLAKSTEEVWRAQARRTLDSLRDRLNKEVVSGRIDYDDDLQLQEWAKENLNDVSNGGPTSDGFMIELGSEKFIWDGSPDCARPSFVTEGRFMDDEAPLHNIPEQAEKMIEQMRQGRDTVHGDNFYWNFDDSPELLEWVIVPRSGMGFNNEYPVIGGIKNPNYRSILIQLGTQTDEVMKPYQPLIKQMKSISIAIYGILILLFCFVVFSMFVFLFKKEECT